MKMSCRSVAGPAFVALAVLALSAAPRAFGGFIRVEDFESLASGPIDGQGDWRAGGGTAVVEADPDDPANQVLAVTTDSARVYRGLGIPEGGRRMVFLRFRVAEKQTFGLGPSPFSGPTEFSDFGPEVGMSNADFDLRAWNGDEQYDELLALAPGVWHNLWMFVDTGAGTFALWLNADAGAPADPVLDRLRVDGVGADLFGFRSGVGRAMRTFFIKTGGGNSSVNSGPLRIDDLYLETVDGALNLANPSEPGIEIVGHSFDFEAGTLTLTWTSRPGLVYRITASSDLADGFPRVLADGIPGDAVGAETTALVALPDGASRVFVRVEEEPPAG